MAKLPGKPEDSSKKVAARGARAKTKNRKIDYVNIEMVGVIKFVQCFDREEVELEQGGDQHGKSKKKPTGGGWPSGRRSTGTKPRRCTKGTS